MSQEDKVFLNLAGEFAVAFELNRRKILASVTYGASKSADIFAMDSRMSKIIRIEVKTTTTGVGEDECRWVVGARALASGACSPDVFWVLVQLPSPWKGACSDFEVYGKQSPRFFVLSSDELYQAAKARSDDFNARYLQKHGKAFEGAGVPNLLTRHVSSHEGRWDKISNRLGGGNQRPDVR